MKKRNVLIGITGGIAAYKTLEVMRLLVKTGHEVKTILTANACRFVTRVTVETLSGHPAALEMFASRDRASMDHLDLASWADVLLVAPATANIIGKMANGIADDLLSTTYLALPRATPLVLAPAMNTRMWTHPAVRRNLETMRGEMGVSYRQVGPVDKLLACGEEGMGGMASPEEIVAQIQAVLGEVDG